MTHSELFEKGLAKRKAVVGEKYVEAAFERAGEFGADFQEILTEYCWGASWGREALTDRERSLLNIGIIGALGRVDELKLHLRGAVRNGVTKEEISDTLIHLAIYAGIPAGLEGFRLAQQMYKELEAEDD